MLCCHRTNKYLVCTTKSYYLPSRSRRSLNSSVPGDLQVFIDKARPTNSGNFEQFTYTPNPIVSNIKPLRGLAAGGIPITVRGDWLTSIQKPLIVLFNENYTSSFPCQTATDRKVMTCVQPSYPYPVAAGKSVEVNVTFVMDDVPRMSLQLREPFSFWSNPVFEPLSSFGKRVFDIDDEDHIKIEGSNLNVVDLQYYIIRLGDSKWCNVTKLEIRVSLLCMYVCTLPACLAICLSVFVFPCIHYLIFSWLSGCLIYHSFIPVFCVAAVVHA